MTILFALPTAPAWFYRRDYGRVRMLECACGFAYVARATKALPARCIHCHGASRIDRSARHSRYKPGAARRVA